MSAVFPVETHVKGVGEIRTVPFSYANFPEVLAGETLYSAVVEASPDGLVIGAPSVNAIIVDGVPVGQAILAVVSAGATGVDYTLTCLCTTSSGSILEVRGVLSVTDDR